MKTKTRLTGMGLVAGLLLTMAVPAGPAAAATSCDWMSRTINSEQARVDRFSTCTYIGIRHYYDPIWSANNYWTSWYGGTGKSYTTPKNPVLTRHEATGY